jgi:hypothetical protein
LQANLDKANECMRLISFETYWHLRLDKKESTRIPKPAGSSVFRQLTSKGYNVKDFKKKERVLVF